MPRLDADAGKEERDRISTEAWWDNWAKDMGWSEGWRDEIQPGWRKENEKPPEK